MCFYGKKKINERKIKVSNLYINRMKIDRFFFLFTTGFFFLFTVGDAVRSIRKKNNKVSLFVIKLKRASGCVNAQIKKMLSAGQACVHITHGWKK